MTTITVLRPTAVHAPRATAAAAALFTAVLGWLDRIGQQRASHRAVAERHAEAAEVRKFAHANAGHDPRFAADLLAAADRHERA